MRFIGQPHIMKELYFLLQDLYRDTSRTANFLFRGPSGYGKTTMALEAARYLAGDGSFEVYLADWTEYRFRKRVIFIDEVHRIKEHEKLYHVMDSREHIFLFATNHDGVLPEAFSNRCHQFIFSEYSTDELGLIASRYAESEHGFHLLEKDIISIVDAGNRNPRIIKELVDKIGAYLRISHDRPENVDFPSLIRDVFSIEQGLDVLCRKYLEILENVGGHASINLLKSMLHIDEATLKQNIEPILIRKGLLQITSKGRSLVA